MKFHSPLQPFQSLCSPDTIVSFCIPSDIVGTDVSRAAHVSFEIQLARSRRQTSTHCQRFERLFHISGHFCGPVSRIRGQPSTAGQFLARLEHTKSPRRGLLQGQFHPKLPGLSTEPLGYEFRAMQGPAKTLQQVNNQQLSTAQPFPEVTLPDGSRVQPGTFGACLANIRRYNQGERGEVEDAIRLALLKLVSLPYGRLDLFWSRRDTTTPHPSQACRSKLDRLTCFLPRSELPATTPVDAS